MKHLLFVASVCALLVAFTSCETDSPDSGSGSDTPPTMGTPTPEPTPDPMATPTPTPTPDPMATPTPAPTPAPNGSIGQIPYGIPVPGKPGFVQSPFAPDQGYVDVRGFPPNTEVKDPYSSKIFLVP